MHLPLLNRGRRCRAGHRLRTDSKGSGWAPAGSDHESGAGSRSDHQPPDAAVRVPALATPASLPWLRLDADHAPARRRARRAAVRAVRLERLDRLLERVADVVLGHTLRFEQVAEVSPSIELRLQVVDRHPHLVSQVAEHLLADRVVERRTRAATRRRWG